MTEDKASIAEKIRALQARTTTNGCTEFEAKAAMDKIAELMKKYRLSMSDIEIEDEGCDTLEIFTGRRQRHPVFGCLNAIASYTGCKVWTNQTRTSVNVVFFGLQSDVETAKYLYHVAKNAIDGETECFKRTYTYLEADSRRKSSIAFGNGMATSMSNKLASMIVDAEGACTGSGTSLVVVKDAIVRSEFDKLGVKLTTKRSTSRSYDDDAYYAGRMAGTKVTFNKGVTGEQKSLR